MLLSRTLPQRLQRMSILLLGLLISLSLGLNGCGSKTDPKPPKKTGADQQTSDPDTSASPAPAAKKPDSPSIDPATQPGTAKPSTTDKPAGIASTPTTTPGPGTSPTTPEKFTRQKRPDTSVPLTNPKPSVAVPVAPAGTPATINPPPAFQSELHTEVVTGIGFSLIDSAVASSSGDGIIKLTKIADSKELLKIDTGASVAGMAMSPYGKTLVTVGAKGVKLWEVEKRKELAGLTEKPTLAIAYSEGGIDMAISRSDSVEIWDAISKKLKHTLKVKGAAALAFMFNGQVLATGDAAGQIQLWNIEDGKLLTKASVNTGPILGLAVSSANDRLAAAGKDKTTLMTIQGQSSSTIIKPLAQLAGGRSVSYSQDGQLLALIGSDNTIHLANGSTGVVRKILKTNAGQATVNTVLFSSDGTYLGAGGSKEAKGLGAGVVTLWEVQKIIPK